MDFQGKAYSLLTIKEVNEEQRIIRGIASTPTPDRMDDIVVPEGAKFKTPMPLLLFHKHDKPVGNVTFAEPNQDGIPFEASIPKVSEPGTIKDRVDEAWHSVKYNLIAAVSIGFRAMNDGIEALKTGGLKFNEWEWLELSLVSVPAQPEAVITGIKSIDKELLSAAEKRPEESAASEPAASGRGSALKKKSRVRGVNLKLEEKTMSLAKQIEALEAKRAANVAALDELAEKSADESRSLDEDEAEQFDQLESEIDEIDGDLKRLKKLVTYKAEKSVAQTDNGGRSQGAASASRAGSIQLPPKKEKLQPGIAFARIARCIGLANTRGGRNSGMSPAAIAKEMYGENSPVYGQFVKAAVPAATTDDADWAGFLVGDETSAFADFAEFLRPMTILGQFGTGGIPSLRRVPFRVPLISQVSGGEGYWVGEGKAKPLTEWTGSRTTLEPLKVANIAVATEELLRDSSPSADMMIRDELAAALRERLDEDFIDPGVAAVPGVSPASITNGLTPIGSQGCTADNIRCDLKNLVNEFTAANNPLTSGVIIMPATLAVSLSFLRNPLGQPEFTGISRTGGSFESWPVIVSQYVPDGTVVLLNAGDIYLGDDGGVEIDVSREASLEMDNAPSHDSDTPTPSTLVSMWQTNSVAFRAGRTINWARRRDTGVALLTGADWGCCDTV